jgi:hypothetical protein
MASLSGRRFRTMTRRLRDLLQNLGTIRNYRGVVALDGFATMHDAARLADPAGRRSTFWNLECHTSSSASACPPSRPN